MKKQLGAIALLAGIAVFLSVKIGGAIGGKLSVAEVRALAQRTIADNGFFIRPDMALAIAVIESGDLNNPNAGMNPHATRFEPQVLDVSTGLMQTLLGTAKWLATDMGYTAFGVPRATDLYKPEVSMYFGCAYLDWLQDYKNTSRSEDWIVQSYNAGPGNSSGFYLQKYKKVQITLEKELK